MDITSDSKHQSISQKQTDQLYGRLKYSTYGSTIVALVLVFIVGFRTEQHLAPLAWFAVIFAVSLYRWFTARTYNRLNDADKSIYDWRLRFNIGTYLAAITWALPMWLFYPVGYPEYQVLMILGLAGVAGGAIAILSYDKTVVTYFLLAILLGIDSRLIFEGGQLSYELAVLVLLYFLFLLKGGRDIANSFYELLELRKDTEDHNLTLLSTTERIARIGYWQWDMESDFIELSTNLAIICGASDRISSFDACLKKVHRDDKKRVQMAIKSAQETGQESSVEYRLQQSGSKRWIIMNQVVDRLSDTSGKQFLLGTVQDISVIKSAEQKIFDMAYYDELTGLANRGHFREHLAEQVKHANRHSTQLAILYLDLDGFKEINDSLGHLMGDLYLKEVSGLLKQQIRKDDFISRFGGDEFCILLEGINDGVYAALTAKRCLEIGGQGIKLGDREIIPKMSIGIAIFPQDGKDSESLLRAADSAMRSSKSDAKSSFSFYDPCMSESSAKRLSLEADLRTAIKNNEFKLVYQPKVSLASGKILAVEALIRWIHPVRGFVPPDEFIDTSERIGLIDDIGEWVLETACRQQQIWKSQGLSLEMAVNISSSHFGSDSFVQYAKRIKRQFDIKDGELEVEITESMSRDPLQHIKVSEELHLEGIKVAIDDFGTGYSSLSVLKQLQVDTLKIDRAFIQNLPADQPSVLMVKAIINMALGLGFDVIAEGVETEEQAKFLQEQGCPNIQGYFYSRPVDAELIPELVRKNFKLLTLPDALLTLSV